MAYTLKENVENFIMVDGPFKGKEYVHGVKYEEVPPGEKHKFEAVKAVAKPAGKPAGKLKAVVGKGQKSEVGGQKSEGKKKDASEGDKPATRTADKPQAGKASRQDAKTQRRVSHKQRINK